MLKVDGIERTVPAAETIKRVAQAAESLGVTRLADITGLDRIGIPVYSSVVPRSDDVLSVYNGKGIRPSTHRSARLWRRSSDRPRLRARPALIEGSFSD